MMVASAFFEKKAKNIVVLYTKKDIVNPDLRDDCCEYIALEDFKNTGKTAKTVILSGHGKPPLYAGHTISEVAKVIAGFSLPLVV
jgi:hypothetical protein